MDNKTKIIFIHGNGNSTPQDNWFPYVKRELEKSGQTVIARQFPDADLARASHWLLFLKEELKADKDSIIVGHSTGGIAALRFAEQYPILGTILVGVYYTDLGMEKEKQSGYFDEPWDWDAIKKNQQWVVQFASTDDPWIPIEEPRFIHRQTDSNYHEFTDQGHFGGDYNKKEFPELVETIKEKLGLTEKEHLEIS